MFTNVSKLKKKKIGKNQQAVNKFLSICPFCQRYANIYAK